MSHDKKSTRERWTPLEFSGENATLKCARIKRLFHSIRERSITKIILSHALKENILTKPIASLLSGERKKKRRCVRTIVSDFYVIIKF